MVTTLKPILKGEQYRTLLGLKTGKHEFSGLCVHIIPNENTTSLTEYLIFNKNCIDGLSGPNSERPKLFSGSNGHEYYDTDLVKRIYFYDSWKDALGVNV